MWQDSNVLLPVKNYLSYEICYNNMHSEWVLVVTTLISSTWKRVDSAVENGDKSNHSKYGNVTSISAVIIVDALVITSYFGVYKDV